MRFRKAILIIAGLLSWLSIGISGEMMKSGDPLALGDFSYAGLLILSVIFLHWALRSFLIPVHRIPQSHIHKMRIAVAGKYTKGFFSGVVGVGYILLALHVYAFLDRTVTERPSFLHVALFLIALGVFAQTRAALEYLCDALTDDTEKAIKRVPPV